MNDTQNITKNPLGKMEAGFLAKAGAHPTFSLAFVHQILGHTKQDPTHPSRLESVIGKARLSCFNSGHRIEDHFVDITEMVAIGSGAQRPVKTVLLSRYAFDLGTTNSSVAEALGASREKPVCGVLEIDQPLLH